MSAAVLGSASMLNDGDVEGSDEVDDDDDDDDDDDAEDDEVNDGGGTRSD